MFHLGVLISIVLHFFAVAWIVTGAGARADDDQSVLAGGPDSSPAVSRNGQSDEDVVVDPRRRSTFIIPDEIDGPDPNGAPKHQPQTLKDPSGDFNNCQRSQQPPTASLPRWNVSDDAGQWAESDLDTFFDDFRQLSDIHKFLNMLEWFRPNLIDFQTIGKSSEGRPLKIFVIGYKWGRPRRSDKTWIVIQAGAHGCDWISVSTALYMGFQMIEEYSKNKPDYTRSPRKPRRKPRSYSERRNARVFAWVTSLLNFYMIAFLVPANPDGYVYSWEQRRQWRKTRSNHSSTSCPHKEAPHCDYFKDAVAGVDLDRNWPYRGTWGISEDAVYQRDLSDPCKDVFRGQCGFSEPEALAVGMYLLNLVKKPTLRVGAFLDYQAYGLSIVRPWSYDATPTSDDAYQLGLSLEMAHALRKYLGVNYTVNRSMQPSHPGTASDWVYGTLGVRASFTITQTGDQSEEFGYCAPKARIKKEGEAQFRALQALVAYVNEHGAHPSDALGHRDLEDPLQRLKPRFYLPPWFEKSVMLSLTIVPLCLCLMCICYVQFCNTSRLIFMERVSHAKMNQTYECHQVELATLDRESLLLGFGRQKSCGSPRSPRST